MPAPGYARRLRRSGSTELDVAEITDLVVDHLLNEPSRRLAFDEPYVSFEDGSATRRAVVFHLLREEEAVDGAAETGITRLPVELRDRVREQLQAGRRLPQELVGTEELVGEPRLDGDWPPEGRPRL